MTTSVLSRVLGMVDRADFVSGSQRASTELSPEQVARVLDALDPARGQRILVIGVGSGYVARLLELVVGRAGWVVAVEPNRAMARHARARLEACGSMVRVVVADPACLPNSVLGTRYHRLLATDPVEVVPQRWVIGTVVSGRLLVPVQLARVAGATATAVLQRTHGRLEGTSLVPDGHDRADGRGCGLMDARDRDCWISAAWLRHAPGDALALVRLISRAPRFAGPSPLRPHESAGDLAAWLYGQRPTHLTIASTKSGLVVGASTPTGVSGVRLDGGGVVEAGRPDQARGQLQRWATVWRECGRPGLTRMTPTATPQETGWRITATVTTPSRDQQGGVDGRE